MKRKVNSRQFKVDSKESDSLDVENIRRGEYSGGQGRKRDNTEFAKDSENQRPAPLGG
jgi:hypothetical protein